MDADKFNSIVEQYIDVVYTAEGTIDDYTVNAVDSEADTTETHIDKE